MFRRRTNAASPDMPFLDHLEELRWRIVRAGAAIVCGVGLGFYAVSHWHLLDVLQQPVLPFLPAGRLSFADPTDPLRITISLAMLVGVIVASPVILYQLWAFLSPALHRHEKRAIMAAVGGGAFLFAGGAAFAYLVILPMSLPWYFDLGSDFIPAIMAPEYFNFLSSMILICGISFELPMLILAASAIGLVTPTFLVRHRRHAALLMFVAGALLTPGDAVSMTVMLTLPLYLLFELSILLSRWVYRRREGSRMVLIALFTPSAYLLARSLRRSRPTAAVA